MELDLQLPFFSLILFLVIAVILLFLLSCFLSVNLIVSSVPFFFLINRLYLILYPPLCTHIVSSIIFFFLEPHLQHMEVLRLGVKSELRLSDYATATATPDPSCICKLLCSLQQHRILNPLSEAMDGTHIPMTPCQVLNLLSYNRNSSNLYY